MQSPKEGEAASPLTGEGDKIIAGASDYLEQQFLNHLFRTTKFTGPTTVYVSLHTAALTDAGTGAEVSGGSYARVTVTAVNANWDVPIVSGTTYQTANTNAVTFPSPTANWGTVTDFGVWDAATTGNLLVAGTLTTSRNIQNGDNAPSFAAGALTVTID